MNNKDVRLKAKGSGVALWQVAEKMNVSEPTLYRKLRHELTVEEKAKIFAIIDELAIAK